MFTMPDTEIMNQNELSDIIRNKAKIERVLHIREDNSLQDIQIVSWKDYVGAFDLAAGIMVAGWYFIDNYVNVSHYMIRLINVLQETHYHYDNNSHQELNGKLQGELTEIKVDNKKLAHQVEDKVNIMRNSGL